MSNVVGIDRQPVVSQDLDLEAADALTALKALVAKIENGEIPMQQWLLIYDQRRSDGGVLRATLDSDLTIATVIYLMESVKLDILLTGRTEV